jgi:hypothetical protein
MWTTPPPLHRSIDQSTEEIDRLLTVIAPGGLVITRENNRC